MNAEKTNAACAAVLNVVAQGFNLPKELLLGRAREAHIAFPRQVAMALAVHLVPEAGDRHVASFFGRDPGTVRHARKHVADLSATESNVALQVNALCSQARQAVAQISDPADQSVRCEIVEDEHDWRIALVYPTHVALVGRFPTRTDALRHARLDGWKLC